MRILMMILVLMLANNGPTMPESPETVRGANGLPGPRV